MSNILILDDHTIVRLGMKLLLREVFLGSRVFDAHDGSSAISILKGQKMDLIIMDVNMPGTDVFKMIETILIIDPMAKILILSVNPEEMYTERLFKLGVRGYINKASSEAEIIYAINQVLQGKKYISENLKRVYAENYLSGRHHNPLDALSEKELHVAKHLAKGLTQKQICNLMNLHPSTIGTHKTRIFEKLAVTNVVDLSKIFANELLMQS